MRLRSFLIPSGLLLVAALAVFAYGDRASAGILKTFPSVCLGDWFEPANAIGEPQLHSNEHAADFISANSTYPSKSGAKLFCSGFSNEALKEIRPQRIHLKVSWSIGAGDTTGASGSGASGQTSFMDMLVAQAYAQETDSSAPADSPEPAAATDAAAEATPSDPNGGESSENSVQTPADAASDSAAPGETAIPDVPQAESESQTAAVKDAFEALGSLLERSPEDTGDRILVTYTLDGSTWMPLAEVGSHNFKDRVIEVPMDGINIGTDISKLQVAFEYQGERAESVHIDGMTLEVSYQKLSELDKKVVFQEVVKEMPPFESQTLLAIRGVWPFVAVKTLAAAPAGTSTDPEAKGAVALWLFDMREKEKGGYVFAEGEAVSAESTLALKGDHLFWTIGTSSLYAFNLAEQTFAVSSGLEVTPEGEQRFTFEGIPWTVISRAGNIYFYSAKTGEVSSDDDGDAQRRFGDEYLKGLIGYRQDLVDLRLIDPRPEPDER